MELNSVLDSDDYFMSVAFLTALRSKDPSRKVGVCIVNKDGKIVGVGYNRSPGDISIPWNVKDKAEGWINTKYPYILYAEMDAILNKSCESLEDCTIYSLLLPYNECAKLIVESGIKQLIYYVDKYSTGENGESLEATKILFDKGNVKYKKFEPHQQDTVNFFNIMEKQTVRRTA